MDLAPITLFTYNRPDHTQKTLDALSKNPEASQSTLYVFCDGPKANASEEERETINKVVKIVKKEQRFKDVIISVQEQNQGLAKSIVTGVTEIVNKHDSVIVLEDDIVTSSGFLKYMNNALRIYANDTEVMHISGYMYPHKEDLPESFFLKVPLCWGWATWKSSWSNYNDDPLNLWLRLAEQNALVEFDKFGHNFLSQQLAYNITGQLNTWFIKWHASVFINSGYTLFPSKSLVNNIGFDDSGIHNKRHTQFLHDSLETTIKIERVEIAEHELAASAITAFYRALRLSVNKPSLKQKLKQKTKRLAFKTVPVLKRTIPKPKFILNKSYLGKQVKLYVRARLNNSIVGSYTYVSENAIINNTVIGKFCSIGPNFISGWGLHPTKGISSHPMFYSNAKQNGMTLVTSNKFNETKSIQIGNDVFIGMNVVVLDGVTIGNGAIIGAGSVVSKDIPPYAIAAGNPIKIMKYRFDEDIIKKLLKIQWWNFSSDQLHLVEKYFYDIDNFIKACVNLQVEDRVKEKSSINES